MECDSEDHRLPFLSRKKNTGMDEGGEEEGKRALSCIYAAYFRPVPHESRANVYDSASSHSSEPDTRHQLGVLLPPHSINSTVVFSAGQCI